MMPIDLNIQDWPLPYAGKLKIRNVEQVDLLVIHCTELPDLATAREYGERVLYAAGGTGNSGHYYIDRDGRIVCFVPKTRIANHTRGYNPRSIGIELVNNGRYPNWFDSRRQTMTEPYSETQLLSLVNLIKYLKEELPNLKYIAGHEDLDTGSIPASDDSTLFIRRKRDPGELFPWSRFESLGLERLAPD